MSCSCHLCEPWNMLAQECADEERLNELQQQRLAVHGLTPKGLGHEGPTQPSRLTRRRVEQRDGRVVVIDDAFDLTNAQDREKIRQMLDEAERSVATITGVEREFPPPPKRDPYITPFFRAVCNDLEEQRLREYLRSRL